MRLSIPKTDNVNVAFPNQNMINSLTLRERSYSNITVYLFGHVT